MFSARLTQLIESNWREIAELAARRLAADPRSSNYHQMKPAEIHDRAYEILHNLSFWLVAGDRVELHRRYVALGQIRCAEGMPVMQVVRKLQVIKQAVREYVRDHRMGPDAVELHGEYDLTSALDLFFDEAIYGIVKGFELQWEFDEDRMDSVLNGPSA
ncbi:MAG: hypothetical protein NTV70_26255 [Acidobacteria bacterium]|nr:hypothetical protein [Acidobacteriota bacterium]